MVKLTLEGDPFGVTVAGENEQVAPVGKVPQLSDTC
jgi:hypothetical protein